MKKVIGAIFVLLCIATHCVAQTDGVTGGKLKPSIPHQNDADQIFKEDGTKFELFGGRDDLMFPKSFGMDACDINSDLEHCPKVRQ